MDERPTPRTWNRGRSRQRLPNGGARIGESAAAAYYLAMALEDDLKLVVLIFQRTPQAGVFHFQL